eukprot:CAMPEP_0202955454 /NCGR_PEP_ID=MMETSP1396-20130829/18_1 /ASSEMBLY_ACC=CAM_ASM_000872 /TAXON_ID= /ORGANISM="Pseudokeronopsis sp., Strain Brazil" /LENGTH=96 /DNA_ID=CAMNT_0049672069 /DNA_START=185 /DNA_END=472 /DNA_ORIENTATION=-
MRPILLKTRTSISNTIITLMSAALDPNTSTNWNNPIPVELSPLKTKWFGQTDMNMSIKPTTEMEIGDNTRQPLTERTFQPQPRCSNRLRALTEATK